MKMIIRPTTFSSHCVCVTASPNGSAAMTVSMSSVECSSVAEPPSAISDVEAKNAVPFCSPAMI